MNVMLEVEDMKEITIIIKCLHIHLTLVIIEINKPSNNPHILNNPLILNNLHILNNPHILNNLLTINNLNSNNNHNNKINQDSRVYLIMSPKL